MVYSQDKTIVCGDSNKVKVIIKYQAKSEILGTFLLL